MELGVDARDGVGEAGRVRRVELLELMPISSTLLLLSMCASATMSVLLTATTRLVQALVEHRCAELVSQRLRCGDVAIEARGLGLHARRRIADGKSVLIVEGRHATLLALTHNIVQRCLTALLHGGVVVAKSRAAGPTALLSVPLTTGLSVPLRLPLATRLSVTLATRLLRFTEGHST